MVTKLKIIVGIINIGVGNIGSVMNMLKRLGIKSVLVTDENHFHGVTHLILPGVGSFDAGILNLNNSGLKDILWDKVFNEKLPILGICLGMQMMTNGSEEGNQLGLGWISAEVNLLKLKDNTIKVPHMGWNRPQIVRSSPLLKDIEQNCRFYFVHSYAVSCHNHEDVILKVNYGGIEFVAGFQNKNIFGVQFHPEKSHRFGMQILSNFIG